MSLVTRALSAGATLRPITVRGKARLALHRTPRAAIASLPSRAFGSTVPSYSSGVGEGAEAFEDIKVKPYIETKSAKAAHHGEPSPPQIMLLFRIGTRSRTHDIRHCRYSDVQDLDRL